MNQKTKIIIPAAGYGTRVNSPESKELLISPINGKPLIQFALDIANDNYFDVHVITRKEKKGLIAYLNNYSNVKTQIIEPSKEWPDTILKSIEFWNEKNILILPDTFFKPVNVIKAIDQSLDRASVAVGAFCADDYKTFGVFDSGASLYSLCEKPNSTNSNTMAWGILGFKKEIGLELFNALLESTFDHEWKTTGLNYERFMLEEFSDLTR